MFLVNFVRSSYWQFACLPALSSKLKRFLIHTQHETWVKKKRKREREQHIRELCNRNRTRTVALTQDWQDLRQIFANQDKKQQVTKQEKISFLFCFLLDIVVKRRMLWLLLWLLLICQSPEVIQIACNTRHWNNNNDKNTHKQQ